MRKLLPWMLVLLAAVSACAALGLRHRDRLELESRIAELEADRQRQRGEIERLRGELAERREPPPSPGAFLTALLGGDATGERGSEEDAGPPESDGDEMAEMLGGILGGEFFQQVQVQMAQQRVRELERDVELTDRERKEIAALFTRQAEEIAEMSADMVAGEPLDLQDFGRDYTDESEELRRILGDRRFEQYEEGRTRRFEEQQEIGFQTQYRFFASEVGLSPDQHDAIEPLMRAYDLSPGAGMASVDFEAGGEARSMRALMQASLEKRREQSDDLRAELAELLDDEQLDRFDAWIERQEAESEMMMSFMPDVMMPGFQ